MFSLGPAEQAREDARHRAAGRKHVPPLQPWETEELALDDELWASLCRSDVDVAALSRRAAHLLAAYHAPTDPSVYEARLAGGSEPGESGEIEERRYADSYATEAGGA